MEERSDASAIPWPTLHHVNLKTMRMQEMIDWYGTVVGMTPNFQNPGIAFLSNDAANHRLALMSLPHFVEHPQKLQHVGMHHLAFEYPVLDDLLATYVRLKAQDIRPHACLDHGMTTSFYYVDPDGNSVELQVDNYGDWVQSSDFTRNDPAFAANPIGVNFDPDQLVAAREAGATHETIYQRAYRGDFEPEAPLDLRVGP
jgi:catechol 2,3-dioxygenase